MINKGNYRIQYCLLCVLVCILFVLIFNNRYPHIKEKPIMAFSVESLDSYQPNNENSAGKIYFNEEQFNEIQTSLNKINENNLNVSELSDFYASLFTAIAVIMAIMAMIGWGSIINKLDKNEEQIKAMKDENEKQINAMKEQEKQQISNMEKDMKELKDAIEEYRKLENEVQILLRKGKYADRVQEKILLEDIEATFDWDLSPDDIEELNKYYKGFKKEQEDNVLVNINLAKYLMSNENYIEAENVYKVVEATTVLPNGSTVKPLFYRFLGQFQKIKYDEMKEIESDKFENLEKVLEKSKEYYNKSIDFSNEIEQERAKENLVVILIEMGKLNIKMNNETEATKYFGDAYDILVNEKSKDFNTYWDQARVEFYRSNMIKTSMVDSYLQKAINEIKTKNEGRIFIEKLRKELMEFESIEKMGFPGDEGTIDGLEKKLKNKLL